MRHQSGQQLPSANEMSRRAQQAFARIRDGATFRQVKMQADRYRKVFLCKVQRMRGARHIGQQAEPMYDPFLGEVHHAVRNTLGNSKIVCGHKEIPRRHGVKLRI